MPVAPESVVSPRDRWRMHDVIHSTVDWALAIGLWDEEPTMVIRWNGDEKQPLGNPVSRAYPTWFVLPEELWAPTLALVLAEKRKAAAAYLWGSNESISN
jgi:hypothetical protein